MRGSSLLSFQAIFRCVMCCRYRICACKNQIHIKPQWYPQCIQIQLNQSLLIACTSMISWRCCTTRRPVDHRAVHSRQSSADVDSMHLATSTVSPGAVSPSAVNNSQRRSLFITHLATLCVPWPSFPSPDLGKNSKWKYHYFVDTLMSLKHSVGL